MDLHVFSVARSSLCTGYLCTYPNSVAPRIFPTRFPWQPPLKFKSPCKCAILAPYHAPSTVEWPRRHLSLFRVAHPSLNVAQCESVAEHGRCSCCEIQTSVFFKLPFRRSNLAQAASRQLVALDIRVLNWKLWTISWRAVRRSSKWTTIGRSWRKLLAICSIF